MILTYIDVAKMELYDGMYPKKKEREFYQNDILLIMWGHYGNFRIQAKVCASIFYRPTMHEDAKRYVAECT